jgi:hypothetical protein
MVFVAGIFTSRASSRQNDTSVDVDARDERAT